MIGVHWINSDPRLASVRLRGMIPWRVLKARGEIFDGREIIVATKHNFDPDKVRRETKCMVMDVCDDHFSGQNREHYVKACRIANVVTVNSRTMADIVSRETGREAVVIDDPYEDDEIEPAVGYGVLWFGNSLNLGTLAPHLPIPYPLQIVDSLNWSPQELTSSYVSAGAR